MILSTVDVAGFMPWVLPKSLIESPDTVPSTSYRLSRNVCNIPGEISWFHSIPFLNEKTEALEVAWMRVVVWMRMDPVGT